VVTDQALLGQVQRKVIEPDDLGMTWPSGLWTRDEVVGFLNQRQNRFLVETLLLGSHAVIPAVPHQARQVLPDDCVAILRIAWKDVSGQVIALERGDYWEADHGLDRWAITPGVPRLALDGEAGRQEVVLVPPPDDVGQIDLTYVGLPAVLGNIAFAELITLPDIFVPALMYGVLADMLSKVGRGQDLARAQYCEERYQEGLEAAKILLGGGV
jgi:hypothetical protein